MRYKLLLTFILIAFAGLSAQNSGNVTGVVKSSAGAKLTGATVVLQGTDYGDVSNSEGQFSIKAPEGEYILEISYVGFESKQINIEVKADRTTNIEIILNEKDIMLGEGLTVLGSKSRIKRSVTQTAVPVDIISNENLEKTGNVETAKALTTAVPSFNAQRQTFSDGNDHIIPATLRGLGPDQVLVLVNGKRRHKTSLVTVTPVVGKGSAGTDLNSIPSSAIKRIEVLRDGASSQYGSDAIAGVINIVLKDDAAGADFTTYGGQTAEGDGTQIKAGANAGYKLGENGYINITGEYRDRGPTNRAQPYTGLLYRTEGQGGLSEQENFERDREIMRQRGLSIEDFNLHIGQSDQKNLSGFFNSGYEINENTELYAFGGINHRKSLSSGFYRYPNDPRNNDSIYPNGFLPDLQGTINDKSVAAGIKTENNGWEIDLSNTYGSNSYRYDVLNSLNRSWGEETPFNFYAGKTVFAENTTNLDFSKNFGENIGVPTFLFAFGGEVRYESYEIEQGEEASWSTKDPGYEPGSQGFPGYRPSGAIERTRNSAAVYGGIETDITDRLFAGAGARYENYSDFGDNISGKIMGRYTFDELFTLRGALSTGFRAPSLHQKYYSSTSTIFIQGEQGLMPFEVLTANNDSRVAKALGVGQLEEETSLNYSVGITSEITENTILTVDAYQIDIDDRIVLSGYFTRFDPTVGELLSGIPGVDAVQFFTNAINTQTRGIDVILTHKINLSDYDIGITVAGNYSKTEVGDEIETTDKLGEGYESTLFDRAETARIEEGTPDTKLNVTLDYSYGNFSAFIRNIRYGKVAMRNADPELSQYDQVYNGRWITDVEVSYRLMDQLSIRAGANNILDVYPEKNKPALQSNGRFPYNTATTQFGFAGAYYYAGLKVNL